MISCLKDLSVTSPAAKTPGKLVSEVIWLIIISPFSFVLTPKDFASSERISCPIATKIPSTLSSFLLSKTTDSTLSFPLISKIFALLIISIFLFFFILSKLIVSGRICYHL